MADRFRTRLRAEVTRWVRDGLVTSEQGERIVARYPASTAWFARPIALFSLIGGAFVAAAVALVIAHNWQELHRWVKLGGVVALMIGAYAGGLVVRDRGYPKLGDGVLLIGGGLLLMAMGLVSQFYTLPARPADALLLWWVLLLPAAYALPSLALVMLGYTGAFAWYWTLTFDRTSWLGSELAPNWILVPVALAAAGLLLFPLGLVHGDGRYRSVRRFLEQLGLAALVGSLYPLSFLWRDLSMPDTTGRWPVALPVVRVFAFVAVTAASYWLPRDTPAVRAGLVAVLLAVLVYLVALTGAVSARAPGVIFRALGFADWALIFAASLSLILYGARWGRNAWVNWGIVFLGIHALARYLDLFGTMLQTSLLFFVTGAFVLLLGWALEWLRRRMTAQAAVRRESA